MEVNIVKKWVIGLLIIGVLVLASIMFLKNESHKETAVTDSSTQTSAVTMEESKQESSMDGTEQVTKEDVLSEESETLDDLTESEVEIVIELEEGEKSAGM